MNIRDVLLAKAMAGGGGSGEESIYLVNSHYSIGSGTYYHDGDHDKMIEFFDEGKPVVLKVDTRLFYATSKQNGNILFAGVCMGTDASKLVLDGYYTSGSNSSARLTHNSEF